MNLKLPSVDSVTSINRDGSHYHIHPADVSGRFTWARRAFAGLLLLIYIALPWIPINGHPAVFLDTMERRFHLFGLTFAAQDLWLAFFVISGLGFSLFYVSSVLGRIWCGWACPYTVFLEHVYRRIERWIEGDAPARRKLDTAPLAGAKLAKRLIKHTLFLLVSFLIAHIFLSYFVSLPRLWGMMGGKPGEHLLAFGVVMGLTATLYGAFAFFREQFCIMMCPYGRLQSALTDDNTMVIGYDAKRGEPRGKPGPGIGDCVNCLRCVQVCPTGIDIRNGLQIECIGCANCVDACDAIMDKLARPRGLVRYDSFNGLAGGKTRWVRPRIVVYTALLFAGVAALTLAVSKIRPYQAGLTRLPGAPYYVDQEKNVVRNQFQIRLFNKQMKPRTFTLSLANAPEGTTLSGPEALFTLEPQQERLVAAIVEIPRAVYRGKQSLTLRIVSEPGPVTVEKEFEFTGPDPRLLDETFLQP